MATNAKDRDRALAHARPNELPLPDGDMDIDDEVAAEDGAGPLTGQDALGSKVIVIHPGSQNLRIGLANDALPKTLPMVVARKWRNNESEENGGEPKPKRIKREHDAAVEPERLFGEEVRQKHVVATILLLTESNSLQLNTRQCALTSRSICATTSVESCPIPRSLW